MTGWIWGLVPFKIIGKQFGEFMLEYKLQLLFGSNFSHKSISITEWSTNRHTCDSTRRGFPSSQNLTLFSLKVPHGSDPKSKLELVPRIEA